MHTLAAGIYQTLPLGQRTMAHIETILREEMDRIGAQEIRMPLVQPAEVWQQTDTRVVPVATHPN